MKLTDAEIEELQRQVYIPGYLKCSKCAFGGSFYIPDTNRRNTSEIDVAERRVCPNDGTDLQKVTWRERVKDWEVTVDKEAEELLVEREGNAILGGVLVDSIARRKQCEETIQLQLEAAERTGAALADHTAQLQQSAERERVLREALDHMRYGLEAICESPPCTPKVCSTRKDTGICACSEDVAKEALDKAKAALAQSTSKETGNV